MYKVINKKIKNTLFIISFALGWVSFNFLNIQNDKIIRSHEVKYDMLKEKPILHKIKNNIGIRI